MLKPSGIYPILYAFFDRNNQLNRGAMRTQLETCVNSGAHGIAILGLITEVSALSPDERRRVVEWTNEDLAGRTPLAVTIAGRTAAEQIELARHATENGADWLILQPPLGEKPSSKALQRFFSEVMASTTIPVGIQNVPEILGVGLDADEVVQLHREHPNFTVMKGEGPVVNVKPFLDALGDEVAVFNGRGGLELPDNLRAGCAGMIPAPDCADIQVRLYNAEKSGDSVTADALYHDILPYVVYAMQNINFHVVYGKRMFGERAGIENADVNRTPALPVEEFFLNAMPSWTQRFGEYGKG